ncbi:Meprin A subunit beta [Pseudolycoriella hygida]|uniref:Metalloendopeptidase n=1 Tax=Pseudolycoriella hygida TaxID=35572 RepID=A0A9Q0S6P8_9DIPT|nr:Meprin A subunit beta [Pseudolycoriella hygida]
MKLLLVGLAVIQFILAGPLPKEYVENTPENLELIRSGNYKQDIETLGGQFEGDMVLEERQRRALLGLEKTGLINTDYRWPDGIVPYVLADGYFTQGQKDQIERGLKAIEDASCIRFVPHTNEENYVEIIGEPTGCWSQVGNLRRGKQQLNLQLFEPGVGCFRSGTVVHEFLHTLGFYHMQSATERDDYVLIAWQHIIPGMEHNFNKYGADVITNFGVEYDVVSVMHYNAYAFTRNGFATIIPYDISLIDGMGQHIGMTDLDIKRLNAMYECAPRDEK